MKKGKGRMRMLASAGIVVALIVGVTAMPDARSEDDDDARRGSRPGWRAEKWGEKPPCVSGAPCPLGRYGRGVGRRGGRCGRPRRGMRGGKGRGSGRGRRGAGGRGVGRRAMCPPGGPCCVVGPGARGWGAGRRAGLRGLCMAPGVKMEVKDAEDGARLIITSDDEETAELIRDRLHRMVEMRGRARRPLRLRWKALEDTEDRYREGDREEREKDEAERHERKEKHEHAEERTEMRRMIRQEVRRALRHRMKKHHEKKE